MLFGKIQFGKIKLRKNTLIDANSLMEAVVVLVEPVRPLAWSPPVGVKTPA